MPITRFSDDDYEEVERGIDWLERLEIIKAQRDREATLRETVEYVNKLRSTIVILAGDATIEQVSERYGKEIADLVESARGDNPNDPWFDFFQPALLHN